MYNAQNQNKVKRFNDSVTKIVVLHKFLEVESYFKKVQILTSNSKHSNLLNTQDVPWAAKWIKQLSDTENDIMQKLSIAIIRVAAFFFTSSGKSIMNFRT